MRADSTDQPHTTDADLALGVAVVLDGVCTAVEGWALPLLVVRPAARSESSLVSAALPTDLPYQCRRL